MITWILDKHVDRVRNAPTPFFEGALKRNHIVHGLRDSLLPKPVDLTGIELSGPTIVRGSHGFVNYVQKELNPLPGGFTHPTNFQMTTYIPIMKEFCLNDDFGIIEYGTFNNHSVYYTHLGTQPVFVKPLEDLKKFSGVVVNPKQTIKEAHIEKYGKWIEPNDDCKIIITGIKKVIDEYRVVVVNGKAITMSTYDSQPIIKLSVMEFVNEATQVWNPAAVYVVDIAKTPNGNKIVEYNQFSTSEMYACDQEKIIDALENHLSILNHYI